MTLLTCLRWHASAQDDDLTQAVDKFGAALEVRIARYGGQEPSYVYASALSVCLSFSLDSLSLSVSFVCGGGGEWVCLPVFVRVGVCMHMCGCMRAHVCVFMFIFIHVHRVTVVSLWCPHR